MRAKRRRELQVEGLESRTVLSTAHHLHGLTEAAVNFQRGPVISGTLRGNFGSGQIPLNNQNVGAIVFNGTGRVNPLGRVQEQGVLVQGPNNTLQGEILLQGQKGNLLLGLQSPMPTTIRRLPRAEIGIVNGNGNVAGLQGFGFARLQAGRLGANDASGTFIVTLQMRTIR